MKYEKEEKIENRGTGFLVKLMKTKNKITMQEREKKTPIAERQLAKIAWKRQSPENHYSWRMHVTASGHKVYNFAVWKKAAKIAWKKEDAIRN